MKTPSLILAAIFAGFASLAFARPAKDRNAPLEFPLVLQAERTILLTKAPPLRRDRRFFNELFLYRGVAHGWHLPKSAGARWHREPVGFHVDSNPFNGPEPLRTIAPPPAPRAGEATKPVSKILVGELGLGLAAKSRKHVLVSARLENHIVSLPGWRERRWTVEDFIHLVLEPSGARVVPLGEDIYIMLEAPGREEAFTYGRSRAIQYEHEREEWLREHPYYSPQGLIYQPTGEAPLAPADLPAQATKVRHAAAALAKVADKEVFVHTSVEKRDFEFIPWSGDAPPEEIRLKVEARLTFASVQIVELDAHSLALIQRF